jgi:drug/metabolite transporter (DMT)-like permease
MKNLLKKISSRKFLACIAGAVTGICLLVGADSNDVATVSGAIVALGSIGSYIVAEGKIDAASVKKAVDIIDGAEKDLTK